MQIFIDYSGRSIRMPGERWEHIISRHPEMGRIEYTIRETLLYPDTEMAGTSNNSWIYARWFEGTVLGDKWVLVVVRIDDDDAFVITAWTRNSL